MLTAALLVAVSAALASQAQATPAKSETPPPDRPVTRVVQNLGHDLRRLATKDTLLILAAGAAASVAAYGSDEGVDRWTVSHPASSWTAIGRVGGDGWMMGGLAVATWGAGELTKRRLMAHVGSDLIRAQVLNGSISRGIKIVVDRERPKGGGHSFPSGHTSSSFASAGVLHQHFGWRVGAPAYAAATFVGWTRIRDRAHWLSDTLSGAALGLASARAVTGGHESKSWSVTPVAMPGGGGVVVRW